MARVFISHASKDRDVAAEVHRWLVADGHVVFLDQDLRDGLVGGEEWAPRLYERLRWADAVVCVVTTAYKASTWCTAELAGAQMRGSRLIPLLVEPGVVHPLLTTLQYIDYGTHGPSAARSALRESMSRVGALGWPDGRSPFPGLRPFDTDLHRAFFGRAEEVEELAGLMRTEAAIADSRLVLVVGPSGCGKSSLVRAGLLPVMADEAGWLTISPFFPGRDPQSALAGELAIAGRRLRLGWTLPGVRERISAGELGMLADELLVAASEQQRRRHLLVVVDQLEELLTQAEPAARAAFAAALKPALAGPVHIVATMRPESLPKLLANEQLVRLPLHTFTLRPLRREALPEVIEGPAQLAGIGVDEHLLHRMVADTCTGEALPLLAFTLAELVDGTGRGGRLSMQRYHELGGVPGALRRQADGALATACTARGRGRDDVIAGLLGLVTIDEQGHPTRWRVRRDELPEPVRAELDVFIASRLLTTDMDKSGNVLVEVAHEAILSAWPPLAEAIAAAASGLRARRAVEQAAGEWDERGRPDDGLWEGHQLAAAVGATGARVRQGGRKRSSGRRRLPSLPLGGTLVTERVELSSRAREFLTSSIRRDRGRRRRLASVLSVLLAFALVTAAIAVAQAREATNQQRIATARELVAEAGTLRDTQPRVSLLLSVEALRLDPSGEARESLLTTLLQSHLSATLRGHTDAVSAVAYSPDRHTLATASRDGTAILWDLSDRANPARLAILAGDNGFVGALAYSPDGHTLATGTRDGIAILWDLSDRAHPTRLATLRAHTGPVGAVAFSLDGQTLATASVDETAILWDISDRANPARLATLTGHTGSVGAVAFSPDGHTLATASNDRTAILWDLTDRANPARLTTLRGHNGPIYAAAYSPDGHTLVTASDDLTAILWDVSDRANPARLATLIGHTGPVYAVAFSPDGRTLATAGYDRTAILWDVSDRARPARLTTLIGHNGPVYAVAYSPDGRILATASDDLTAILWDLSDRANPARLTTLTGHNGPVYAVAFGPDGHTLATAGYDRTAILWDLSDRAHPTRLATLTGHNGPVYAVAFSPDGRTLATASGDGTATLWDLSDRVHPARLATLTGHAGFVGAVAFSPAGHTLATASGDGTAILWDLSDPAHPARLATLTGHNGLVGSVAFSPDGRTLVTANYDRTAVLWDVSRRAHPARLATLTGHNGPVYAVAFSPDGHTLATASDDRTAILWDLSDRANPARLATLTDHTGPVVAVAFSPGGHTLATASGDDTAILWDLSDRAQPARLATLIGHTGYVVAVAYSPDGHTLATASGDGTTILWDLSDITAFTSHPVARACAIAGPALSRDDWALYIPGMPYERTCP